MSGIFLSQIKMKGNLLKCSHKKLVLPMINFDFSKKSSGQINVRFFFKSNKNGRKKPDIYLSGPFSPGEYGYSPGENGLIYFK